MSKSESGIERRRQQRVSVGSKSQGLTADVVGFGPVLIFDMSYSGAAFAQPKNKKIEDTDKPLTLHLRSNNEEVQVEGIVIRLSTDVVAVEFKQLNLKAREVIDRVVTDRIIGLNMTRIHSDHYGTSADFNHWYHGPKETNLYLWEHNGQLVKAQIAMGPALLIFEEDRFVFENKTEPGFEAPVINNQQMALKALAIIEQIKSSEPSLVSFKGILTNHVQI